MKINKLNNMKKEIKKNNTRVKHLHEIEEKLQKEWQEEKIFESKALENWNEKYTFEEKNNNKYFITFPYPYMNNRLHLGHAFSFTKCEFQARFQKLLGKNVLLPFGFHCTGMPISAAAKRIENELKNKNLEENNDKIQSKALIEGGVPKEEIYKFADPVYWTKYFPPYGKLDLISFGSCIDFSRSFITTELQKYYDKFVQWHFLKLKKKDYIKYGKRTCIFSRTDNQPCADHDRSKGEGLGPQEYVLIKMKLIDKVPNSFLPYKDKNIYLVAGTLRPETMYGQTNCYILPNGEYGLYEMKNNELFVCCENCAINLSYQDKTKEERVFNALVKIKGSELIGCKISAPLSIYKEVYLFPMESISIDKGTGIVTSVPSDSPDDWINLYELKNNNNLKNKWNLEDYMFYDPVHVIKLNGYSDFPAKDVIERLHINNSNQRELLDKAKEEVYTKGFYNGIMDIGPYKGESIIDAKNKVKDDLLNNNEAILYYEPEGEIINRQGEKCVVALVDQWYICYGEEKWKKFILDYIHSGNFNTYSKSVFKAFEDKINWLKEWTCSRNFGLGSRIPWDKKFLIESLSDSTIYMAYYTISNFLHKDIYGYESNNNITPDMLTEEVFDYIFLGKELNFENTKIDANILKQMRNSFTYWYPMDLRCSGKDLIGNHLTMSLYNHAAVWNNFDYMTRGYFCNGYITVDGEKMSKSLGNFLTMFQLIEKYGADPSRICFADCGDNLDDANFITELCDLSINRLYSFENFVKILINDIWSNNLSITHPDKEINYVNSFDKMFFNNINFLIQESKKGYEEMKYKNVLKYAFYQMINIKDEYILFNGDDYSKLNPTLMIRFLKTFFLLMNPIIPHWTEYMYRTYLNPIFEKFNFQDLIIKFLYNGSFPEINSKIDKKLFYLNQYINKVINSIRERKIRKEKKNKKNSDNNCINIKILHVKDYNENQKIILDILRKQKYDENNKLINTDKLNPLYKKQIAETLKNNDKKELGNFLEFASFLIKEVENYGLDALDEKLQFDEEKVLNENIEILKSLAKVDNIQLEEYNENNKPKGNKESAIPGKPIILVI